MRDFVSKLKMTLKKYYACKRKRVYYKTYFFIIDSLLNTTGLKFSGLESPRLEKYKMVKQPI